MNQIALRLLLVIFLSVTTQASEEKNDENQIAAFESGDLIENKERITESGQFEIVKTNSSQKKLDEKNEEKKNIKDIKSWLESLPKSKEDSQAAEFIDTISPMAVIIAEEKGLYPSVMIAQAGLESGWGSSALANKYNNLMGTKGSWRGNNVTMKTNEEVAGKTVEISAGFSVYSSWADSLEHYGKMLRDGLDWDSEFYKGTWRENTESYRDATSWLVGRYATDTSYARKLNSTIEKYDLNRFDQIEVLDFNYEEFLREVTVEI